MIIKNADEHDFEAAFYYIKTLWNYNHYDMKNTKVVYDRVLKSQDTFAFFLMDDEGSYHGFCHGDFFDTFWMCGKTCYISSLIVNPEDRGKGYGIALMNHVKEIAEEKECRALILDSGMPRKEAHRFYEKYGFEKSCFGFELAL